jgi:hypothetical protein
VQSHIDKWRERVYETMDTGAAGRSESRWEIDALILGKARR